jgi:hypothetical protein
MYYDTLLKHCRRCGYDTAEVKPVVTDSKRDWRDSHDLVGLFEGAPSEITSLTTYTCYVCDKEWLDLTWLTKTEEGYVCDGCMYEDDQIPEEIMEQEVEYEVAIKHDSDKPRYDLIPTEVLDAYATILAFGAKKYSDRNWQRGFTYGRVFGALMRHMWAWWKCEDKDPESGLSHLWHAIFNVAALIYFEAKGVGQDDRVL